MIATNFIDDEVTEISAVDLFCGAGGASAGLIAACDELGYRLNLTAINHWDVAIATHSLNNPGVTHLCADLDNVNPLKVVPGGYLDLLIAAPECTHHSNARGGKPMDEQSRAGADFVVRWANKLYIENILVENVKEFMTWGPLDQNKRPIERLRGQLFLNFIEHLKALDYNVEYRIINAANYGDATTRERLFVKARKTGAGPIVWPEISHSKTGELGFLAKTKKWKPARDIIDWSVKGSSIFDRKKPLKDNTMRRIMKGLEKFGGKPFLSEYHGSTIGNERVRSLDEPLPTQDTSNRFAVCDPYIVMMYGTSNARSIDQPVPTVTAKSNHLYLCEPFVVALNHGKDDSRTYSIDRPMPTITQVDAWGIAQPFLVKYNSTGTAMSLDDPLDTITGKDRFGLVMPMSDGRSALIDILFRMLMPKELAAAMSFPADYQFVGPRDAQVKQIGNAWAILTAKALIRTSIFKHVSQLVGEVAI